MKKKSWYEMTLSELLREVDKLFKEDSPVALSYNYSLGKFPAGWCFIVTNDWHKWLDKGYESTQEYCYQYPEGSVIAFLEYVKENKIPVSKLAHHYTKKDLARMRRQEKETQKMIEELNKNTRKDTPK